MQAKHLLSAVRRHRPLVMMILLLLLAWPAVAWSHAHPEQMTPAPNAVLQQAPQQVTIRFSEDLEAPFSSLKVTNDQGQSVTKGPSQVAGDKPKVMSVALRSLQPGTFTVHWHVVAVDGHTTEGAYHFQLQ